MLTLIKQTGSTDFSHWGFSKEVGKVVMRFSYAKFRIKKRMDTDKWYSTIECV